MADGTPRRPAAVSGPGALSQRTDGGPGAKTQPIRVPTGGAYGEAKASREQQQGAPMAAGGPSPGGAPAPGGAPPIDPGGVFGPTANPGEPITAGVPGVESPAPDSKDVLRVIYESYPSPWIAGLLNG